MGRAVADVMMMLQNRRRKLLIDSPGQCRIVASVVVLPGLALGISTLLALALCRRLMLAPAAAASEAGPDLAPLVFAMLGFAVFAGALILHQAVRFSHRVAGSEQRLRRALERIRAGDLTDRIELRQGDHLFVAAASLNELIDWLREHPPTGVEVQLPGAVAAPSEPPVLAGTP